MKNIGDLSTAIAPGRN